MTRVLQNTAQELRHQFLDANGNVATLADVTLRIVRDDGTELVPTTQATAIDASWYGFTLASVHTTLLDRLTVIWTATVNGITQTATDYVEIVGGFLFTVAEARAQAPLSNTTTYPTDRIIEMRTTVEQALEDELGYALVPRYARARVSGQGFREIRVKPYTRAVRWVTTDDVAMTPTDLALLRVDDTGFIYSGGYWPTGYSNLTVGYEHGLDAPSSEAKRAGLVMLKQWMLASPVDDRTSTFTSTEGGTYALVVPGRNGSIWGIPEADSFVQRHRLVVMA